MKIFKGYNALIIMVAAGVLFLLVGFLVINKNITGNQAPQTNSQQTNSQPSDQIPPAVDPNIQIQADLDAKTADWKTYTNTKYSYEVKYPANLSAGKISTNSVLGDFQNPVQGFDVGPLVFVSLKGDLRKTGADYFNESYNLALHPLAPQPGVSPGGCTLDKINNPSTTVQSVSCTGEGGAGRYGLIKGKNYDVFIDGYSKGFDDQDNTDFANADDYITLLSTFKFTGDNALDVSAAPTPPDSTANPDQATPSAVQSFSVTADDNGATPLEITIPQGTIVDLTFVVSAQNVNFGGLEFKSSVANTGVIQPGASKTVAFTANDSFVFTPYTSSSTIARPYTVKVTVTK
ncbi:MAG TPA: hypothetical protein VL306_02995 [Methylomirabilota bacterium]|nr:hypothetical protein [Methylomirabilota bacterium]